MERRLPAIGGMRGLAAILVTGYHAFLFYTHDVGMPSGLARAWSWGWVGVDFFFVLSAFLLGIPLLRRLEQGFSWSVAGKFWFQRWVRIGPPFYLSIILSWFVLKSQGQAAVSSTDVVAHLLYIQNLTIDWLNQLNVVYWTLAVEFQFYLLLPVLVFAFSSKRWPWALAAGIAISLLWRATVYYPQDGAVSFWRAANVPAFLSHFALGLAAARLYVDGWRPGRRSATVGGIAGAALVLTPLLVWFPTDDPGAYNALSFIYARALIAVGFTVLLFLVLVTNVRVRLVLSHPVAEAGGTLSYALYLVHFPIQAWLIQTFAFRGFATFLTVSTLATLLGAIVWYASFERPIMAWRERVRYARTTPRALAPSPTAGTPPVSA